MIYDLSSWGKQENLHYQIWIPNKIIIYIGIYKKVEKNMQ